MAKKSSRKEITNELSNADIQNKYGMAPPNALELEMKILGAVMMDNQVMNEVVTLIKPEHYYRQANGTIFQAMIQLDERKEPIDPNTLIEELKGSGFLDAVGGVDYILDITNSVATSANADYYARIVLEKFILRKLIHISSGIVTKCFDPTEDTFRVLDEAEQKILDISESLSKKKVTVLADELENFINELSLRHNNHDLISGVPTGYHDLDELTGGFQKSELIIIAGRPSHGKTAFSMNIARNAAVNHGKAVGIFSLEMSVKELVYRMISTEAMVNGQRLRVGKSSNEDWQRVLTSYHRLKTKLYIDETSELSILELRAKARRMKQDFDVDMIIVDYLQLVRGGDNLERRDLEVAQVSRGLKALAKELDIPVVACAQLNRGIEQRGKEKRPLLSDLRESGSIEQDADVVIFVHRPAMGMKLDPESPDYQEILTKAEIIIGKQRNGPVDDVELVFLRDFAKFVDKANNSAIEMAQRHAPPNPF